MKDFIFDWSIFKSDGFKFQDLCADIFKANHYNVRIMEKGGSDEGRDVIIYKHFPQDLLDFDDTPYAWVECKSQVGGSPLNVDKISSNFLYVEREKISYMVFMTNHKFNNEAHNLFVSYNRNPNIKYKVRYIEQEELENILKATPSVYIKYFDVGGKVEEYPRFDLSDFQVKHNVTANSYFFDELEDIQVSIRNTGFTSRQVRLQVSEDIIIEEELEPFEERQVKIRVNKNQLPEEIQMSYKIDHVYVDPFNNKSKVLDLLQSYRSVYICGNAGSGKSRLLNEVARETGRKAVVFDISTDYSKSFLDHLLSGLLGIEIEYLRILPENVIVSYLDKLISQDSIPVFVAYILQKKDALNYDVILSETAEFFHKKLQDEIIFIDNIHCFSLLDYKLLERINEKNLGNYLFFTAREDEIAENCLSLYLERLVKNKQTGVINLTEVDLKKLIQSFLKASCADVSTKSFLLTYQNAANFQQFIFTLKMLRLKEIIAQDGDGKIFLSGNGQVLDIHDYKELYQDLDSYFRTLFPEGEVSEILELGAIYGYKFPVEMMEDFYGEEGCGIIDSLIVHEFLKEDTNDLNGNMFVHFDHELTREIIYNAISPVQKRKLHKRIIQYIENLGESSSLYLYGQLAYHYECVNNIPKVVELSNKEGHCLLQKNHPEAAYSYFQSALKFVNVAQTNNLGNFYDLEADSLNQLIRLHFELWGVHEITGKIRSLEVLSVLLKDIYFKGMATYYFAKYYLKVNHEKESLNRIQQAIDLFRDTEFKVEYGKCLNFKGIILKNIGSFELAKEMHQEAIDIFEKQDFWSGLSTSLADLGAVYLESGEGEKTIDYWRQSLEKAQLSVNSVEICHRLIDYSYILALFDRENPEIKDHMENALFMAEKLGIKPGICRAKINFANFLFFRDTPEVERVKSFIEDAIRLSGETKDDYLGLLSRFSYHTFRKKHTAVFKRDHRDEIEKLWLSCYADNELDGSQGDNRLTNIARCLLAEKSEKICTFIGDSDLKDLKDFMERIEREDPASLEVENPYFSNGFYAIYY